MRRSSPPGDPRANSQPSTYGRVSGTHTYSECNKATQIRACRAVAGKGRSLMVGALLLGFICGVIARVLMPGDVFRNMSGPTSWAVSLGLGLAGALVGYVIFTLGLGIGDTDIFDWGGLLGAIIGALIVLGLAGYFLHRRQPGPTTPTSPPQRQGPPST